MLTNLLLSSSPHHFVLYKSHGFGQLSLTRPSAELKGIDNVLMVGASSRPGNGVPLVLIGAKLVWKKILKKML
jgi:phytoene desaturase (3,4-didehydrolycopene-forming)